MRQMLWWLLIAAALVPGIAGAREYFSGFHRDFSAIPTWDWLLSCSLLAAAAWLGDRGIESAPRHRWKAWDVAALLSVAACALVTHLWRIGDFPPPHGFGFEELETGGLGYYILKSGHVPIEFPLTNLAAATGFRLFGLSAQALRLPFLLGGIAAPLLFFLALRHVVALPAAWAAALFFAANRWAAAVGRFADEMFPSILVLAMALWLFVHLTMRPRQRLAFLLGIAGVELFYAYSGYRVFPVIVFGGVALIMLWRWRQGRLWQNAAQCLVLVAAVWVVSLGPGLGSGVLSEGIRRQATAWRESPPRERTLYARTMDGLHRARVGADLYLTFGDHIPSVNVPDDPMLDPLTGGVVIAALLAALLRWRDPWRLLMLAVAVLPFAAVSVLPRNFEAQRYFLFLLPFFLLVGFFFDDVLRWRWVPAPLTRALLVVGVVAAIGLNIRALQRMIGNPVVQTYYASPVNLLLSEMQRMPAGSRVVPLVETAAIALDPPSMFHWLATQLHGTRPASLADALTLRPGDGYVSWVTQGMPEATALAELVRLVCPNATSRLVRSDNPLATVAVVSITSSAACTSLPAVGLSVRYSKALAGPEHSIDPLVSADTIPLGLRQNAYQPHNPLRIEWHGSVVPSMPGRYSFRLEVSNISATLRVGTAAAEVSHAPERWGSASLPIPMEAAALPLTIEAHIDGGGPPVIRLYWTPPGGHEQLLPPTQLRPADDQPDTNATHPIGRQLPTTPRTP